MHGTIARPLVTVIRRNSTPDFLNKSSDDEKRQYVLPEILQPDKSMLFTAAVSLLTTVLFVGALLGNLLSQRSCQIALTAHEKQPPPKPLQIQAHRGGAGMVAESTLYAFAYAIDINADVIEMDTLFTKDGIPVVWHDFSMTPDKCVDTHPKKRFVGQYVANLTLAELKTLDCGGQQSDGHSQSKTYPGTQIQTLEEVLEFIKCYSQSNIELSIETKIDSRFPNYTLPVEKYITDLVPVLKKHSMVDRVHLASFDWRTIKGIKELYPEARVDGLIDETTVDIVENLFGGINWIEACAMIGCENVSPFHGSLYASGDAGATIHTPGYVPMTTKELVDRAHELGLKVVPWTVDDESTIEKVLLDGVDGIISNYPARVGYVAREMGYSVHLKKPLDAIHSEHDCLRGKTLPPAYQTPTSNPAPEL